MLHYRPDGSPQVFTVSAGSTKFLSVFPCPSKCRIRSNALAVDTAFFPCHVPVSRFVKSYASQRPLNFKNPILLCHVIFFNVIQSIHSYRCNCFLNSEQISHGDLPVLKSTVPNDRFCHQTVPNDPGNKITQGVHRL